MRTCITTANYLNLHRIFLCFENKYGRTGKTVSKTDETVSEIDRKANRHAIKEMQLNILNPWLWLTNLFRHHLLL